MTDPLEQPRLLKAAIERELKGTGMELAPNGFAVVPTDEGAMLELAIKITPEALQTAEQREQAKIDADFEAMMSGVPLRESDDDPEPIDESEAQLDELKDSLKDWDLD